MFSFASGKRGFLKLLDDESEEHIDEAEEQLEKDVTGANLNTSFTKPDPIADDPTTTSPSPFLDGPCLVESSSLMNWACFTRDSTSLEPTKSSWPLFKSEPEPLKPPRPSVKVAPLPPETLKSERGGFTADRDLVMKMLRREQELRIADATQRLYDLQTWDPPPVPPYSIGESIQMQVLREHGVLPSKQNMELYRCLNSLYKDDPQMRKLVMYMKHDRSRPGDLKIGHKWPDVNLMTLGKVPIKLSNLYNNKDLPFVLFGVSRS